MAATLATLRTRIRQRIDKVNSTYITDSELTSYINASYAELYDLLVMANEDYFITGPTSFTLTSSDSGVYSLPSDFYKLRGVDFQLGSNWIALSPYNWNERNVRDRARNPNFNTQTDKTYRMIGSNLRIEPDDNAVGTYRLWYVPAYTALSSDSDAVDTVITRNNWEEYIVVDVGAKILNKEESDASALIGAKRDLVDRIRTMVSERDLDQPESVSDITLNNSAKWW